MSKRQAPSRGTRRDFLVHSSAALAGAPLIGKAALPAISAIPAPRPHGDDTLRVAVVGCGGRGTGAAVQALACEGSVELVAMADAFEDRLESSLEHITASMAEVGPERVRVDDEHKFVGFDAYAKAIDSDVDIVILATPPGFRPQHFEYAVDKGRHVFTEKPMAVDAPGVRQVLAAAAKSREQGLKVGVGLQRHHEARYIETVRRIHEGAIGDIVLLRVYWNGAGVWVKERKPEMTEMEYQMRNWYYFNWLCGDHIVEQHIHNLDVGNWIMGDFPVEAEGQGGREVRTGAEFGEIFDHHAVEFTYADGTKMMSQCRHIPGCKNRVSEYAHGTLGSADVSGGRIESKGGWSWRYGGENPNPYQVEHDDLQRAIREGTELNEAEYGAMSTMTSVLGRLATYSGRVIRMDEALASDSGLRPSDYTWDGVPPTVPDEHGFYPIAVPGVTDPLNPV